MQTYLLREPLEEAGVAPFVDDGGTRRQSIADCGTVGRPNAPQKPASAAVLAVIRDIENGTHR